MNWVARDTLLHELDELRNRVREAVSGHRS